MGKITFIKDQNPEEIEFGLGLAMAMGFTRLKKDTQIWSLVIENSICSWEEQFT